MGLTIPSKIADDQYINSRKINEQLTAKVRGQKTIFEDIEPDVRKAKAEVKKLKDLKNSELLSEITTELGSSEKAKALEAIQEKGASSWLNALPIKSQGYALDKQSFRDAISTPFHSTPFHSTNCHLIVFVATHSLSSTLLIARRVVSSLLATMRCDESRQTCSRKYATMLRKNLCFKR